MIPLPVVRDWQKNVPWPQDEQVEQDLIISRALIELFNHPGIKDEVAFRGGTALHKVILKKPLRYSEDIDLNRLKNEPVKPLLVAIKDALSDMLGTDRAVKPTQNSVKLFYSYQDVNEGTRNLKIEINVRETVPLKPLQYIPYSISSPYFAGSTKLTVFDLEEMIGTKIRALYQRNKGRDLFDLYNCISLNLDWRNVVESFKMLKVDVDRDEYESNLNDKMQDPEFTNDIFPLLPSHVKYKPQDAFDWFKKEILPLL